MIRILIVDDQKSIRERLKYILESESDLDIVGTVDNGYDAIEQVKNIEPDVVLMDMEMPDIDGVLATKIIAQSELGKKVKVLVLSSYDSSEYVTKSIRAGAKGYLLKGASAEEIRDAVRFVHRGYTQIAPGLFEQFIPEPSAHSAITRTSILPPRHLPTELNIAGSSELVLTGFSIPKKVSARAKQISKNNPELLLLDAEVTHVGSKSLSWLQVSALVLAGLGLTGFIYFVRQGLRQPLTTISAAEQAKQIQETPFTGKIEPLQVIRSNSTIPGFVQDLKVKVGQPVRAGEVLMTVRNVEAERSLKEKAQQQQQAVIQQQQATNQQQQALIQQQQALIQQQESSQQRLTILEQQIDSYNQTIVPLRARIATANLKISQGQLQNNQSELIRQKQAFVQKTVTNYQQQQVQYKSKVQQYNNKANLLASGVISRDQVEIARAEAESAKIALESARSDYENAKESLALAQRSQADTQPAESQKLQLQQQLELKEQEDKVKKLQEQLQQERLSYEQLSTTLQSLRQRITAAAKPLSSSPVASDTSLKPMIVEIAANTTGYVVELPINTGDQVFTGTKLVGIANSQQLKATVEMDDRLTSNLETGKRAVIKAKVGRELRNFNGRVANISTSVENNKRKVEVEFLSPTDYLVGQVATVYFPPQ